MQRTSDIVKTYKMILGSCDTCSREFAREQEDTGNTSNEKVKLSGKTRRNSYYTSLRRLYRHICMKQNLNGLRIKHLLRMRYIF